MKRPQLVYLALCFAGTAGAASSIQTEQDAVLRGLSQNATIQLAFIADTTNALALRAREAQWLPQATLSSTSTYTQDSNGVVATAAGTSADQAIPGGGSVHASAEYSGSRLGLEQSGSNASNANSYSVNIAQPLAKGAFAFGDPGYTLKIARLDHDAFTLNQKKALAGNISDIRTKFWTCYQSKVALAIGRNALKYAVDELTSERARFTVGIAAPVDTLSAYLTQLKAQQSLIDNEAAYEIAFKDLCRALNVDSASVAVPDSIVVNIAEMPNVDTFIGQVESYDPDLRVFQVLKEELDLQYHKARNNLLPSVSVGASYGYNSAINQSASIHDNAIYKLIVGYALPTAAGKIAVAQANLARRNNAIDEADHRRALRNQLLELADSFKREHDKLAIAQTALFVSQKYLDAAIKGHELGTIDRLALEQAQNDYVAQAVNFITEQITLKQLEISLDQVSGGVFERFGVKVQ
jgi:outer membrane protein TolC